MTMTIEEFNNKLIEVHALYCQYAFGTQDSDSNSISDLIGYLKWANENIKHNPNPEQYPVITLFQDNA